ncbi:MAG: GDSL-type esterase/lipase family protein [Pirellulales bacterium]
MAPVITSSSTDAAARRPAAKMPRRRKVLYSAIVLLGFLAGCELLLRAVDPEFMQFATAYRRSHAYDPHLGVRLIPAANERLRLSRNDGSTIIDWRLRVDGAGFRRAEDDAAQPGVSQEPTKLIYCLGDSLTMGWGVDFDDSYPLALGRLLGNDYRVVNLGVDARGLLAAAADCQRVSATRKPDIVFYLFCVNDWADDAELAAIRRRADWQHAAVRAWRACQAHSYVARTPQMLAWYARFRNSIAEPKSDLPFVRQARGNSAQMRAQIDFSSREYPRNETTAGLAEFHAWCQQQGVRLIVVVGDSSPETVGMIQCAEALRVEWMAVLADPSWLIQGDAHLNPRGNQALAAHLAYYLVGDRARAIGSE